MSQHADPLHPTPVEAIDAALTPYVADLKRDTAQDLKSLLAKHLGTNLEIEIPIGTVQKSDTVRVFVHNSEASLELILSASTRADGWFIGRTQITVKRTWKNKKVGDHPSEKRLLRDIAKACNASATPQEDRALAKAVRAMRIALEMEDRHYREMEYAHNGSTGRIRVGFGCNQDCHFCWQGRSWPKPPDELIFQWLDELAASGIKQLAIEGGEPLIWRHLPEFITRASHGHGLPVHMNTNAISLGQPGVAERYKAAGLVSILVSFHAADAEVSDRMTRAPGTHKRTVEGIHAALEAGLVVILNCVVERQNVHDVPNHARFVRDEFILKHPENPVMMVNYSQPGPYYEKELFSDAIVPYDEVRPLLLEAAQALHETGVLLEITGTCGFPPCVLDGIPEALPWRQGNTMDPFSACDRQHPDTCGDCAARNHCIGPRREYLSVFGERGLIPFKELPSSDWYERLKQSPAAKYWPSQDG